MAYTFNGTNQLLRLLNAQNSAIAYPFTAVVWAKSSDLANNQVAMTYIRTSDTYNGLGCFLAGANAGDPVNAHGVNSATVSYADGVWHCAAGRSTGATAHDVIADGIVDSNSTSISFEGYGEVQVGGRLTPSFGLGLTGSAAKVAMWNVALGNDELISIAKGFSPRRVRPQSLRVYGPLVRELCAIVNQNLTMTSFAATNSPTVSDHPRSYGF